jgi:hypothetical protein
MAGRKDTKTLSKRYELDPKDTKTFWIQKIRKPLDPKRSKRYENLLDPKGRTLAAPPSSTPTDRHRHRPSTNHKIHPHPPHRTLGVSNRLCIDNPNRQSVISVIVALKLKLSVVPTTQRLTLKHPLSIVSIRHDARELRRNIVSILCESAGLTDFHCGICLNSS